MDLIIRLSSNDTIAIALGGKLKGIRLRYSIQSITNTYYERSIKRNSSSKPSKSTYQ